MAKNSLSDFSSVINQYVGIQEQLLEQLCKIEALINVSLDENFLDYSETTIHDYLWAVSDIARQARSCCEQGLSSALRDLLPFKLSQATF